jgi:hypothetical protein
MSDIVERLLRQVPMNMSPYIPKLVNPDGPVAADTITRLTAENERLRAVIKLMQKLLAQYEVDAPTICEGATE